tara:strand:+ start:398 stop:1084 length:687 start_codon:yes stop_codon:yes gene_type:complete
MGLFEKEKEKYDYVHNAANGYGYKTPRVNWFNKRKETKFAKEMLKCLKKSSTALDIGCGKGNFYEIFKKRFSNLKLYGIDISDIAVKICKEKGYNVQQSYAHQLPFEDNSIDFIYHLDGMEHIPEEWELDTLNDQFRVAKKAVAHSIACHHEKNRKVLRGKDFTPLHINVKESEEWKNIISKIAEKYNFKLTYCNPLGDRRVDMIFKLKKSNIFITIYNYLSKKYLKS